MTGRKMRKSPQIRKICVVDHVTSDVKVVDDATVAEIETGVNAATINLSLRAADKKLIGGYSFQADCETGNVLPVYSYDEALASRERYRSLKPHAEKRFGIAIKDLTTGEIRTFKTFEEAATHLSTDKGTIAYLLNTPAGWYRGKIVRRAGDCSEWPVYDERVVKIAANIKKPEYPVVEVTDHASNATEICASIADFARSIGRNPASASGFYRENPTGKYLGRYSIVRIPVKPIEGRST
jgi:hypothetical protein